MSLLGSAAILLSFDVAADAVAEHDDWHTHEHLPERLSIPGFLRGTRWLAAGAEPRYLVLYEVLEPATLTSAAYLERLNQPSAWTSKMMPHYRNMKRGLCAVAGSFGLGVGNATCLIRFKPLPDAAESLRSWLLRDALPVLPSMRGIGSAHLLEAAASGPMTNEQRIRGADAGVDSALLLMGYDSEAVSELAQDVFAPERLARRGAPDAVHGLYRIDYMLAHAEVAA
jgi:hypothetical protein